MIVGLLGYIGSGKGTVSSVLVNEYGFRQDSFASTLKDACSAIFGWERHMLEGDTKESREWREQVDPWWEEKLGRPGFSPRLALQLIGTDVIRNNFNEDIWFLSVLNRVRQDPNKHVVISDVRFPNEVKFIKDNGGFLIRIDRGPAPVWYETAVLANRGNSIAREIMTKTYPGAHFSEWAWAGTEVDYVISNDSTFDNLTGQVKEIMTKIL